MARPKCLMGDFTNLYGIYKAHQSNVWWTLKVFRPHCDTPAQQSCGRRTYWFHSICPSVVHAVSALWLIAYSWRHQMETLSALLAICAGNSPVPGEFKWCGALMFSLICTQINGWVNNRGAGDLRRHRTHYDVTVMFVDYIHTCMRHKYNPWGNDVSCTISRSISQRSRSLGSFKFLQSGRGGILVDSSSFKLVIYKLISRIDVLSIFCEIALRWMPQGLIDD